MRTREPIDTEQFARDGYAVLRGVLPRAVVAGVAEFLESSEPATNVRLRRELGIGLDADLPSAIAAAFASSAHLAPDTRHIAIGHYPLDVRLSPNLWTVARVAALQDVLAALLGNGPLFMHMPPAARFVVPGNIYSAVPAHQDQAYNGHLPSFVTVWVPLVPIDEACGGVVVYTGGDARAREIAASTGPWIGPCSTDGLQPVAPAFDPGDVLLLSPWAVHASAANTSTRVRRSIDYRFFVGGRSGKHALDVHGGVVLNPAVRDE